VRLAAGLITSGQTFGVKKDFNPLWAAKLNQMQRHGQMNHAFGPALAEGLVNTGDEITEGQWLWFGTYFTL
jgi:hypothetical protein